MKSLLTEFTFIDCGHLVQLWTDGEELHALAPCEVCEKMVRAAIKGAFPDTKITIVD